MNTNNKLSAIGLSTQALAAKTLINSVAWRKAKEKRDNARFQGRESLVQKMDAAARIVSAAAKGIRQYEDVFESAIVTLIDEVTGFGDTVEELLAPAIK